MSQELSEVSGEVTSAGDVRAADPNVEESAYEFGGRGVLRSHDPAGGRARAGYVGAESGEVFADDLAAGAVPALADLQVEATAADLAEAFGGAGAQVLLEGFQHSGL